MSKLLYFPVSVDEAAIWQTLVTLAASHGYIGQRGEGNVAALLTAIAGGEVATVLLADTPRDMAIDHLRSQSPEHPSLAEALGDIADELDAARQREQQ